jgi:hypothetical protein
MAMAEASGASVAVFTLMMRVYWKRRLENWFWPAMISIGLMHVAIICFYPWPPTRKMAKSDLLFIWVDFFVYVGLVALIAWLSERLARRVGKA